MKKSIIVLGAELHEQEESDFLKTLFTALPEIDIHHVTCKNSKNLAVISADLNYPVLVAMGQSAANAWLAAGELEQLGGVLIIHPNELPNFLSHQLKQTGLLIHGEDTLLTSSAILKTLQRPRPDIAQLIADNPQKLIEVIKDFILRFAGAKYEDLGYVITQESIGKLFPASAPGAVPVFEEENCYVGAVQPEQYLPYEHINYRDEIHVVISGSGYFRHGDGDDIEVKQGDIAYVKAFEKHRWSNWSPDFRLIFIQCGRNPLSI